LTRRETPTIPAGHLWLDQPPVFHLDFRRVFFYTYGMETLTIPISLLISLVTAIATAGGVWFVTQKRVRDLETRADKQDQRHDQVIAAIGDLRADMAAGLNGLRADMTAGLNGLRADMTAEINGLRADMDTKIDGLRTDINDVKVELAKVQGSNMALNEKFDLFLQGRLIPATVQSPSIVAA